MVAVMLFMPFAAFFAFALPFVVVLVAVSEIFIATAPATTEGGAIRFVFSMLTDIALPTSFSTFFLAIGTGASVCLRTDRPDQQEGEHYHPETFLCHDETRILVKNALQTHRPLANYTRASA